MIEMVDFVKGFKRPFSDLKKFAIGVVIMLIPIVNIIGYGYGLKCAESVLKKKGGYKLPKWENWGDLFIKGLIAIVISIIFFIPALIFAAFAFAGLFTANITEAFMGSPDALITMFASVGVVSLIITAILFLGAALILPLALMNYVKKWKFGDAFKIKKLTKKITGKYIVVWIVSLVYMVILTAILSIIPFIGSGIASFMLAVTTTGTWFAEAYKGK